LHAKVHCRIALLNDPADVLVLRLPRKNRGRDSLRWKSITIFYVIIVSFYSLHLIIDRILLPEHCAILCKLLDTIPREVT
jgi:hypothetical protein